MAPNYRMSVHRRHSDTRLILMGDFDAESAHLLLDYLKRNIERFSRVVIQTDGLRCIYPFGLDLLRSKLSLLADREIRLEFAGEHAAKIAPESSSLSSLHSE